MQLCSSCTHNQIPIGGFSDNLWCERGGSSVGTYKENKPLSGVSHPSLAAGLLRHEEARKRDDKRPRRDQDSAVTQYYMLNCSTYGQYAQTNTYSDV